LLIENDLKGAAGYSLPPLSTDRIDSLSGNYGFFPVHAFRNALLAGSLITIFHE